MVSESVRALTQVMGVTCDLWNHLLIFMPVLWEVLRAPSDMCREQEQMWRDARTVFPFNPGGIMPATHLQIRAVTKYASRLLCLQSKSADFRG